MNLLVKPPCFLLLAAALCMLVTDAEHDTYRHEFEEADYEERDLEPNVVALERDWPAAEPPCKKCYNGGRKDKDGICICPTGVRGQCCMWARPNADGNNPDTDGVDKALEDGGWDEMNELGLGEEEEQFHEVEEVAVPNKRGRLISKCSKCYHGGTLLSSGRCACAARYTGRCCAWHKGSWHYHSGEDESDEGGEKEEGLDDIINQGWFWGWNRKCPKCYNGGTLKSDGKCICASKYSGRCCQFPSLSWNGKCTKCYNGGTLKSDGSCICAGKYTKRCCTIWTHTSSLTYEEDKSAKKEDEG